MPSSLRGGFGDLDIKWGETWRFVNESGFMQGAWPAGGMIAWPQGVFGSMRVRYPPAVTPTDYTN